VQHIAAQSTNVQSIVMTADITDSHRPLRPLSPGVDVARGIRENIREKMNGTVFFITVACRNSKKNNSETWATASEESLQAEKT
jgi:hypothetical protein